MRNGKPTVRFMLYGGFIIATIAAASLSYSNLNSEDVYWFLISYLFLTFSLLIYLLITMGKSLMLDGWETSKKRLVKFSKCFVLLILCLYIFNLIFTPEDINHLSIFSTALGLSLGICFFDELFNKKRT